MIEIYLNGEKKEIPEGLTLAALLDWLKLPNDRIAVEYDREIVPRGRWRETTIQSGGRLEVVHFVGGGSGAALADFFEMAADARKSPSGRRNWRHEL